MTAEYVITTREQLKEIGSELFNELKFVSSYGRTNWQAYQRYQDELAEKLLNVAPEPTELKHEAVKILLKRALYARQIDYVKGDADRASQGVMKALLGCKYDLTRDDIDTVFKTIFDQHSWNIGYIYGGEILEAIVKDEKDPNSLYTLWEIVKWYLISVDEGEGNTWGRTARWRTESLLKSLKNIFTPEKIQQLKTLPDYQKFSDKSRQSFLVKAISKDNVPLSFLVEKETK